MVTGDVALRFFPERTKLPAETLGEVSGFAFFLLAREYDGMAAPCGDGVYGRGKMGNKKERNMVGNGKENGTSYVECCTHA